MSLLHKFINHRCLRQQVACGLPFYRTMNSLVTKDADGDFRHYMLESLVGNQNTMSLPKLQKELSSTDARVGLERHFILKDLKVSLNKKKLLLCLKELNRLSTIVCEKGNLTGVKWVGNEYDLAVANSCTLIIEYQRNGKTLDESSFKRAYQMRFGTAFMEVPGLTLWKIISKMKETAPEIEFNPINRLLIWNFNPIFPVQNNTKKDVQNKKDQVNEITKKVSKIQIDKLDTEDTTKDIVTFHDAISNKGHSHDSLSPFKISEQTQGSRQTANEVISEYFTPQMPGMNDLPSLGRGLSLANQLTADQWKEGALLGHMLPLDHDSTSNSEAVYMNVHDPFCFVAVGVQGAGKSHTLSCILENCLVPFPLGNGIINLKSPMTSLILHYDDNVTSVCESVGLLSSNPTLKMKLCGTDLVSLPTVPKDKAVILVSPTYYLQRKAFYGDHCQVKPLLFKWKSLTADHIKRIMGIKEGDNQLYVASFLALLRSYQRKAIWPEFASFMEQVRERYNLKMQQGPLDQRIALLESMVAESEVNESLRADSLDLQTCASTGKILIITDLTDPLLGKSEANSLFQVLTEQFRAMPTNGGKLLALDEAHKFMDGVKSDGLSEAIVTCARLMRHDGLRLAVSTQSPKALAPELLELVSVAVLHHFHSNDWFSYLMKKLSLDESDWAKILSLRPGTGLVFATSHNFSDKVVEGCSSFKVKIRQRITADFGASKQNK